MTDRKSLLIIDDEEDLGEVLATLLEDDFDCEYQISGTLGMNSIKEKAYDIIITDLEMPDVSGLAIIKYVIDQNRQAIVFVSTGHSIDHPKVDEALAAGAKDVIAKPFPDAELLTNKINSYFD